MSELGKVTGVAAAMALLGLFGGKKATAQRQIIHEVPETQLPEASQTLPLYMLAMLFKNLGNPYGDRVFDGFYEAARELSSEAAYFGPEYPTTEGQIQIIDELIAQQVSLIAIAANAYDALQPAAARAMSSRIMIISYDSPMNPNSRILHVNQAASEVVGRTLIQAAYEIMEGEGQFAILSATPSSPNQNIWIAWMQTELSEPRYQRIQMAGIVYGYDNVEQSMDRTIDLLRNFPELKVIIAPTTVGILGAAIIVEERQLQGRVAVTGVGLPSEMRPYVDSGTVPLFYLWNPVDLGYLTGYAAYALLSQQIYGVPGEHISAGRLGDDFTIVESVDGGREVILGGLMRFDQSNIDDFMGF